MVDERYMNRRSSRRFLCAELVEARWKDKAGKLRRKVGNLEDISRFGACLQMEGPVPLETSVTLRCDGLDLTGVVKYCFYRDSSYFLGLEFEEGTQWSRLRFRPQHMLDPGDLVRRSSRRPGAESRPASSLPN